MILAIDFDNTIMDTKHPVEGQKMGPPMPDALESLMDLHDAGHTLIIHTTRANNPSGRKSVADWLEYYDVDYDSIMPKPAADFYIDDRAVEFQDWEDTLVEIGFEN